MRSAIVFGASGQIGQPLLARLTAQGWHVDALSRTPHVDTPRVHWLRGDLDHADGLPVACDAIFSCGPLDHFSAWYARTNIDCARVLAFGSTSADVKQASVDAAERELAARLLSGERRVLETAAMRGVTATLLRPTLVYGAGGDRTLTRIAAIARRWHRFVLPHDAIGLRQPVHVDDLAQAAFAAVDAPAAGGQVYALPGGETLFYRDMVARVLAALTPPAHLHVMPSRAFAVLLTIARTTGIANGFGAAALARMRDDLVFDAGPARRDFGYAPRTFVPTDAMFLPPGERAAVCQ